MALETLKQSSSAVKRDPSFSKGEKGLEEKKKAWDRVGEVQGRQLVKEAAMHDDDQPSLGILVIFEIAIWGSIGLVSYVLIRGILAALGWE